MSRDIAVWRPNGRLIGPADAARHHAEICGRPFTSFVPGPEMSAFVDAVVNRYHETRAVSELPWAVEPDVADDCAIMAIQSALGDDMLAIVRELAEARGLVVFDPQRNVVHQSDGTATVGRLELFDGGTIMSPGEDTIADAVRDLSGAKWFVVFERRPDHYVQAGHGEHAGVPAGRFVIEYRSGGPDQHWRAEDVSRVGVVQAFLRYAREDDAWSDGLSWSPL